MHLLYLKPRPFYLSHNFSLDFDEFSYIEMLGRFWSSVFIPAVTLFFFVLCEEGRGSSCIAVPGLICARGGDALVLPQTVTVNRKLKEKHDDTAISRKTNEITKGAETEEDYPELDPAPNTKPAIKSGPIAHDTSIMPYIPGSEPPDHP